MKKTFTLLSVGCLLSLSIVGCQGNKPMDPAAIQAKADSLFNAKAAALTDSVNNACKAGSAAAEQALIDSILTANGKKIAKK